MEGFGSGPAPTLSFPEAPCGQNASCTDTDGSVGASVFHVSGSGRRAVVSHPAGQAPFLALRYLRY